MKSCSRSSMTTVRERMLLPGQERWLQPSKGRLNRRIWTYSYTLWCMYFKQIKLTHTFTLERLNYLYKSLPSFTWITFNFMPVCPVKGVMVQIYAKNHRLIHVSYFYLTQQKPSCLYNIVSFTIFLNKCYFMKIDS